MARLTDDELRALSQDLESPRVERKAELKTTKTTKKARQTICAFANDLVGLGAPGVLFVGLNDDGSPSGLTVDDPLLRLLDGYFIDGNLQPVPTHEVRVLTIADAQCAVVVVEPHPAPPVRWKGDVWVRSGPLVRIAQPEDERRLRERGRANTLPFESQPVVGARFDDLNPLHFDAYLARTIGALTRRENSRSLEHQLRAQRMITGGGEPTLVGLLFFGHDHTHFRPNLLIKMVRFAGDEPFDPVIDQADIKDPLIDAPQVAMAHLDAWNATPLDQSSVAHAAAPTWPRMAIREALINAICHRDYALPSPIMVQAFTDRIEITSPGGPMYPITPANFETIGVPAYRNPRLAEALHAFGYVERHNTGLAKIRAYMRRNQNPTPVFDVTADRVRIVLPARST